MAGPSSRNLRRRTAPTELVSGQLVPAALPALSSRTSLLYSLRLVLAVLIAIELDRKLGIQSGYWIPMTALLVQKPAVFETLARASARILGTLLGAYASTILLTHISPHPINLALATTLCALLAFATNGVNYGLFSVCLTAYIAFLLSLNQIPGPEIARLPSPLYPPRRPHRPRHPRRRPASPWHHTHRRLTRLTPPRPCIVHSP